MNTTPNSIPSLSSLYWSDVTIRRSFSAMTTGLMVAAGMWLMLQPVPNALPQAEPPIEVVYAPYVEVGALVFAGLAGLVLLRRYLFVKEVLRHGNTIYGIVDKTDVYDTNMHSDSNTIKTMPTYAYYVTVRYEVQGAEYKVCFKLMHSPSTYGLKKDGDVELIVLDSAPGNPLIRSVLYFDRDRKGRR